MYLAGYSKKIVCGHSNSNLIKTLSLRHSSRFKIKISTTSNQVNPNIQNPHRCDINTLPFKAVSTTHLRSTNAQ